MRKFLYSKKGKALLFILQTMSVCIMVVSLCILFLYTTINVHNAYGSFRYKINWFDTVSEYEDSDYFNTMLSNQVTETIRYAVIRNQMEADGKFDGKKSIDIKAYAKRYDLLQKEFHSASYAIEDLIKWGQYGIEYTNEHNEYATNLFSSNATDAVNAQSKKKFEQAVAIQKEAAIASNLQETVSEELIPFQKTGETVQYQTQNGWELIERYLSGEGKNLSSYVSEDISYDELCEYLENTANSLAYNYSQYKIYNQMFQDNQTNLSYYITLENKDGSRTVYTNIKAKTQEEAKTTIEGMGKYINYDATTMEYRTNTQMTETQLVEEINYYDYTYAGNSQVLIGIDTQYLYQDGFLEGYNAYNNIVPKISYLLLTVVMAFLLALGLFLISTVLTGKSEKNGEAKLVFFDHLKSELFLILVVILLGGITALSIFIVGELYFYEIENKLICMIAGIETALIYTILFCFWLSFVRRIKAHSFWKNSLLCGLLRLLRKGLHLVFCGVQKTVAHVYNDSGLTVRTWLPYLIFLTGNFMLLLLGRFGFAVAVLFDMGVGIYQFRENKAREKIVRGIEIIKEGNLTYQVETKGMHGGNLILADSVNTLGEGIRKAVETSMKDERLKADLITNVSHDIKTPLTSIINYVDLIKRENIQNEKIEKYIDVLDAKSQRLKHLTEDLVEASKISSGNIALIMEKINFVELVNQSIGEFSEKFEERGIQLVANLLEHPVLIEADSRRIWRVIENLGNNIAKYALENTRVYLDLREIQKEDGKYAVLSMKNISKQPLNIDASELTERFIRGDVSRSTEGSGLGLSIAKNLTELQKGKFEIYLDGDLFKVSLEFAVMEE